MYKMSYRNSLEFRCKYTELRLNLVKFRYAVCLEYGYTKTYIQDVSKIKQLLLNDK